MVARAPEGARRRRRLVRGHVVRNSQGAGLCSCGQLSHGAAVVTKGVRYTLIAFIDEEQEVEEEEEDGFRGGCYNNRSCAVKLSYRIVNHR